LRGLEIPGEIIVLPAFNLANEQKTTLENALQDLVDFGKIRPDLADGIRTRLAENLITTKDLRAMIDANVDLIAAGKSATSRTALVNQLLAKLHLYVPEILHAYLSNSKLPFLNR